MNPDAPPSATAPPSAHKRWHWLGLITLVSAAGFSLALLFFILVSTSSRGRFDERFEPLLVAAQAVALALIVLLLGLGLWLWWRWRQHLFGSRLIAKLSTLFALAGFVPTLILYSVSSLFIAQGFEPRFDERVESALQIALRLQRAQFERLNAQWREELLSALQTLPPQQSGSATLETLHRRLGARALLLRDASGRILAQSGDVPATPQRLLDEMHEPQPGQPGAPALLRASVLWTHSSGGSGSGGAPLRLEAWRAPNDELLHEGQRIESTFLEQQSRARETRALARGYFSSLTITFFLAVCAAILLAVFFGSRLARPLLLLSAGMRSVAAGDLSPKPVSLAPDELSGLTQTFAAMTAQLAQARSSAEENFSALEAARAELQSVLDNLTNGVMVLDGQWNLLAANPGAARILRTELAPWFGQPLEAIPGAQELGGNMRAFFAAQAQWPPKAPDDPQAYWREAHPLRTGIAQIEITVLARGARLPDIPGVPSQPRYLLVLDDITDILQAQRALAWREVARRMAHEIRNPLTPIQLATERLEHKLAARLSAEDAAFLQRSVKVVIDQIDAMKGMVEAFRDYARAPEATHRPIDLNALIAEVLTLYPGSESGAIHFTPDPALPLIAGDAAQWRQVLHNLLANALEAPAPGRPKQVQVSTQIQPGLPGQAEHGRALLRVTDNGEGFAPLLLARAGEPYVTTKPRGTGLGLAVVRKICEDHGAQITITNRPTTEGCGACISILFKNAAPAGIRWDSA